MESTLVERTILLRPILIIDNFLLGFVLVEGCILMESALVQRLIGMVIVRLLRICLVVVRWLALLVALLIRRRHEIGRVNHTALFLID